MKARVTALSNWPKRVQHIMNHGWHIASALLFIGVDTNLDFAKICDNFNMSFSFMVLRK